MVDLYQKIFLIINYLIKQKKIAKMMMDDD